MRRLGDLLLGQFRKVANGTDCDLKRSDSCATLDILLIEGKLKDSKKMADGNEDFRCGGKLDLYPGLISNMYPFDVATFRSLRF